VIESEGSSVSQTSLVEGGDIRDHKIGKTTLEKIQESEASIRNL